MHVRLRHRFFLSGRPAGPALGLGACAAAGRWLGIRPCFRRAGPCLHRGDISCATIGRRKILAERRERTECAERLPAKPLRVRHPSLVRARVAASRIFLFQDLLARRAKLLGHLVEFSLTLHLEPQMIEAGRLSPLGNRKVDARIVQHPFCVVGFEHARTGAEERGVEADRIRQVFNGDVNVQTLHDDLLL